MSTHTIQTLVWRKVATYLPSLVGPYRESGMCLIRTPFTVCVGYFRDDAMGGQLMFWATDERLFSYLQLTDAQAEWAYVKEGDENGTGFYEL